MASYCNLHVRCCNMHVKRPKSRRVTSMLHETSTYMHVEIDYNMRVTSMLVNACNCLLDACNMHVTSTTFRIGEATNIHNSWVFMFLMTIDIISTVLVLTF